jgi:hypothetical protein
LHLCGSMLSGWDLRSNHRCLFEPERAERYCLLRRQRLHAE